MADDKGALALAKAVVDKVGPDVGEAFGPWLRAVGHLGRVAETSTEFVSRILVDAIGRISPEALAPPPKSLAAPLIEALPAVEEEPELAELYTELLAKAMDRDRRGLVHPGYRSVLASLSPDEARALEGLGFPEAGWSPGLLHLTVRGLESSTVFSTVTYVDLTSKVVSPSIEAHFVSFGRHLQLENPDAVPMYLDNLRRLSVLGGPPGGWAPVSWDTGDDPRGVPPEAEKLAGTWAKKGWHIRYEWGVESLTSFGAGFIGACLPREPATRPEASVQFYRIA